MGDSTSELSFDTANLFLCVLVTVGMQLSFFFVAAAFKFDKVTDFAGGTNFVVLAVLTFFLAHTYYLRQIIATIMVALWGIRLSGFLLYRIVKIGEDHRFDEIRNNLLKFAGFWLFQAVWVISVSLMVIYTNSADVKPDSPNIWYMNHIQDFTGVFGIIMFVIGLGVETIADQQKFFYRQNPLNKGHWCDTGLWKYSRHPNYAGELTIWWGCFVLCTPAFLDFPYRWSGIWSPVFITLLLLFASGIPNLERSMDSRYGQLEEYWTYKTSTSPLLLFIPSWYSILPKIVKCVFFFEFPFYTSHSKLNERSVLAPNRANPEEADPVSAQGSANPSNGSRTASPANKAD